MNVINKGIWIWCEFSSKDSDYLIKIQDIVQNKLRGPKFKIHLTLAGSFQKIDNSSVEELKKYCDQHSSIEVNTHSYGSKDKFFQSLFISIANSKELEDLRKALVVQPQCTTIKVWLNNHGLISGFLCALFAKANKTAKAA